MRPVVAFNLARAQLLRRSGVITLPASSFHVSSSVLLAKGLIGNPSPIRPPTPVPLDQTRELELRKLDFDDYVSKIDTTLTEQQIAFVNNIKRQIKGGPKSPRCMCILLNHAIINSLLIIKKVLF